MPKLPPLIVRTAFVALVVTLLPGCAHLDRMGIMGDGSQAPVMDVPEARAALTRGDYAAASAAYEQAALAERPERAAQYWLAAAEAASAGRNPDRALGLVANIPVETLDAEEFGRLQILRAESLLAKDQPYEAAKALPASSAHLPTLAARIEALRAKALFAGSEPAPPAPPAATPAISPTAVNLGGTALLLPLAGNLAAPAEAVRDGFLAAHLRNGAEGRLRIYDVGGNSGDNTLEAYRAALADGAAVVVGPLRRESVAAMAQQGTPAVPVLALNYLDETQLAPPRFYQFGLAPEDEARSAAEHAAGQGLRRVLALVPQTDWGERAYNAFRQRFQALGGEVIETARYMPGQKEYSAVVRTLLRAQQPASEPPPPGAELPPLRRQDADMLFLVARPMEGRLIAPMLRFYYAGDLPTYATALVYDGRPDGDTAGLRFCDMPWMLSDAANLAERAEAADLASQQRYPRLFAFGYDAQALAAMMRPGASGSLMHMPGMTGLLSVGGQGAVRRALQCAQIREAGVQLLETPAASSLVQ